MPTVTNQAIDEVIATCDGDLRGAVMALLLVNERLETELKYFYELALHLSPPIQPVQATASHDMDSSTR
jgi:hypothetical protein